MQSNLDKIEATGKVTGMSFRKIQLSAFVAIVFAVAAGTAFANPSASTSSGGGGGSIAPQTCDSDVWKTMEDRARIETEREIMQNQNLIFKPDSVLQYACFDKMAAHAAKNVGVIFTHTTYWSGQEIIKWEGGQGYKGTGDAMKDAVTSSMKTFVQSSYNHDPLGGRGGELGLQRQTVTDVPQRGSDYSCNQMSAVWRVAKCFNFMHSGTFAEKDGFYPFKNLAAGPGGTNNIQGYESKNDVRQWPEPCTGANPVPGGWSDAYNSGRNDSGGNFNRHFQFGTPNQQAFTKVRELIEPGQCGQRIQTGVQIVLSPSSQQTQPDAVCSNPGCTYNGTSCVAASGGGGGQQ